MTISTYAANKTLDFWLRGVAMTAPTRVYLSLHTADPGNTGAGEVTLGAWPAYARLDLAGGGAIASGFSAAASKATENLLQLLYAANNGAGPVVVPFAGVWDAATGGNFLFGGIFTAQRTINPTDELLVKAGDIDFGVT